MKLSNLQTLVWDGVQTGFFLSTFTQQLGRENADVPDNYFTLIYAAGTSPTRMPKPKREESGSLSKSERQKLQNLYTQEGSAPHGSMLNLVKASNLPI